MNFLAHGSEIIFDLRPCGCDPRRRSSLCAKSTWRGLEAKGAMVSPKHRSTLAEVAKVSRPERTTADKAIYVTAKLQLSELTKFSLFL